MSPRLRSILRITFTVLFVATAPVVVLYTSGYRYHTQKRRIEKTGIIRVETLPSEAHVSLNGVLQRRATPLSAARLLPEDYDVRIEKDGYVPWVGTATVRSGETTFLVGIRLVKDMLPRLMREGALDRAAYDERRGRIAFTQETERGLELIVRDEDGQESLAARFPAGTHDMLSMEWSPSGDDLLVRDTTEGGPTHVFLIGASEDGVSSRALHELFPSGRLRARWTEDGTILLTAPDGIHALKRTGAPTLILSSRDIVDAVADGRSWLLLARTKDGVSFERLEDGRRSQISMLPDGDWAFADTDAPPIAIDASRGKIALPMHGAATHDGMRIQRPFEGSNALVWNDYEIATLDTESAARRTVTRVGATLRDAIRLTDGRVVYATNDGVFLLALDGDGHTISTEIARVSGSDALHVSSDGATLRFIGTIGNRSGLYERDL